MKPFDLEKALAGEPVRCRDERYKVLRLDHFPEVTQTKFKVVALIQKDGEVMLDQFAENGEYLDRRESDFDLFMAPKKRTVWVNFYEGGVAEYFVHENNARLSVIPDEVLKNKAIAVPVEIDVSWLETLEGRP